MPCSWANDGGLVLTVRVEGAKSNTGQVFLSLFTSDKNYLKEPVQYKELPVDEKGEVVWTFRNLNTGTLAVSAIYDEDGNGELNTGFMGIPTELVGMSNNAKGMFGPPSFKKASFLFLESREIVIRLSTAKD